MIERRGFKFTHRGWFWFCPVWLSLGSDDIAVRDPWPDWLFFAALKLEAARIFISSAIWPDYEPCFMVRVTGEV